jgi:hypothetical protein
VINAGYKRFVSMPGGHPIDVMDRAKRAHQHLKKAIQNNWWK